MLPTKKSSAPIQKEWPALIRVIFQMEKTNRKRNQGERETQERVRGREKGSRREKEREREQERVRVRIGKRERDSGEGGCCPLHHPAHAQGASAPWPGQPPAAGEAPAAR